MLDCLKIGGLYFKASQNMFSCKKRNKYDFKTTAISASLIASWFTVVVPVFCALLYGAACLQGRCKSQNPGTDTSATGTTGRTSAVAKAAAIQPQPTTSSTGRVKPVDSSTSTAAKSESKEPLPSAVSVKPAAVKKAVKPEFQQFANFEKFICLSAETTSSDVAPYRKLTLAMFSGKEFQVQYSKEALVGHLKALVSTFDEFEKYKIRIVYKKVEIFSNDLDRIDQYIQSDNVRVSLIQVML
ncbi:MAG: hypothetical protein H0X51_09855 [Parachlamydiaceae bacterium]|nr:hypothetical protein [Parachlamydiaceae bacterium]